MNSPQSHPQAREFREVPQEDEYDPFGETLYMIRGKEESHCRLEEAIMNMTDDLMAIYKSKCKIADKWQRLAPNSIFANVAAINAHKFLMTWVHQYWAEVKERLEGDSN